MRRFIPFARLFPATLLACLLFSATTPFTVDDMLDVINVQINELSSDGRFAVVITGSLRSRLGIDNTRFGDPTYIAPGASDVWLVDTQSGQRSRIVEKGQVRSARFSPDGSKLALRVLEDGEFVLKIWSGGRMRPVKLPGGKVADDNGEISWLNDDLVTALRNSGWRAKARQAFDAETRAPIVFHSSKEPFLSWITLRRMANERSIAAVNPATGQGRELAASALRNQFRVSEDGRFLVTYDDIEKKTDYDNLGMGDSRIEVRPTSADAKPRVIVASSRDGAPIGSKNGLYYAFAKKDGSVWFGKLDDEKPRELIAKKKDDDKDKKGDAKNEDAKKDGDKKDDDKERLTPVAITPDGKALIALTSKESGGSIPRTPRSERSL